MGNKVRITRNSRYAPIRYEATRPYATRLGKLHVAEAKKGAARRMAFIQKDLFLLLLREIQQLGKSPGPGPGQAEIANVQIYGGFQDGGRIIFDVRHELARSLLATDSTEIPCGAVAFPTRSFYLHFGPGTGLRDNGMEIEGAFVQHLVEDKALLIGLVSAGSFSYKAFWQLSMGEQMTGVRVELNNPSESVSAALDRSIDDVMTRNQAARDQVSQVERQLNEQYGEIVKVPSPVENLTDKRELLHSALQLVLNTLFFLAAVPEDVQEDWEEEAPAEVVAQLHSEKTGTRKTAENNLANQGYVRVSFVGRHYAESAEAKALSEAMGTGRTMPTHLRRGHFRNQPYGPERSLRKTVFIAPVVVNAGKCEPAGRIYDTSRA